MKYLVVHCEDRNVSADTRAGGLLETARLPYLQHLAQAGAIGVLSPRPRGMVARWRRARPVAQAESSLAWLGQGLLVSQVTGLAGGPGQCYAASADVDVAPQEIAWCCELVTQHDGRLIDPTAGRIPTPEAATLIQALNDRLGRQGMRWVTGQGSHHVLLVQAPELLSPVSKAALEPPERLIGRFWRRHLPRHELGLWLRQLIEQASAVLDGHDTNRVRVDLGENPANMMWLWGPSADATVVPFQDRAGLSAAVLSRSFFLRGIARLLGLTWIEGLANFDEASCQHLQQRVLQVLASHDVAYVHLPIESRDLVERQWIMERLDQMVIRPVAEALMGYGAFRCLAAVDDLSSRSTTFIAVGTNLPGRPAVRLSAQEARKTGLVFHDGTALLNWFLGAPMREPETSRANEPPRTP